MSTYISIRHTILYNDFVNAKRCVFALYVYCILANNWCFLANCMWLGGGIRKEHTFVHHQRLACFSMLQKVCVPVCWHYSTNMLILQYQAAGTAVSVIMYQNRYCNTLTRPRLLFKSKWMIAVILYLIDFLSPNLFLYRFEAVSHPLFFIQL